MFLTFKNIFQIQVCVNFIDSHKVVLQFVQIIEIWVPYVHFMMLRFDLINQLQQPILNTMFL